MSKSMLTFDEIMDFSGLNREIYNDIVMQYKSKGIVPFIGAGLSVDAGFPVWNSFLEQAYKKHMNEELFGEFDPLDIASKLYNQIGKINYFEDISMNFGSKSDSEWDEIAKKMQNKAIGLLPKLFNELVVTTNFDRLLEHIYPSTVVSHPSHNGQLNHAIQRGTNTIFKLHGCVSDREDVIFTRESYDKAYPQNGKKTPVLVALESILTRNRCLFIGCSLEMDYTVKHWARMTKRAEVEGISHFAIINCEDDRNKRLKRQKELGDMNIRPIIYDKANHDAVRIILHQLYIDTGGGVPLNNLIKENDYFTGREDILKKLKKGFQSNTHNEQVISGLGGMGKTQTALKYAYMHLKEYTDGVWWINAENNVEMLRSCRDILVEGGAINELQALHLNPDELISCWQIWLSKHKNQLLIFDNIESEVQLLGFIPRNYYGHVLLTTRNEIFNGKPTLKIQQMHASEATDFLLKRTGRQEKYDSQDGKSEIAKRLGYLPLALEQAAAFMTISGLSFIGYLELLSDYNLKLLEKEYAKPDEAYYKEVVATTWKVSFDRIKEKDSRVSRLFYVFAYADSNNIPLDVFMEQKRMLPKDLQKVLANKLSVIDAIVLLRNYSLIERNDKDDYFISIHRLVQEVVRNALYRKDDSSFLNYCFNVFHQALPREYDDKRETRVLFERIAGHAIITARNYVKNYQDNFEKLQDAVNVFNLCGNGYNSIAYFQLALDAFSFAKDACERIFDKEHPDIASAYNDIAVVYFKQGLYSEALDYYKKCLAIREKVLERDHLDMATIYNNIAVLCVHQGRYDYALELYQKALAIRENVLGKEHSNTAVIYNNIARLYNERGVYNKALEWCEKSLTIREKIFGEEHPDTALAYKSTAEIYVNIGDYDMALEYYNKDLSICRKVLGNEHPDTATAYNGIAIVYFKQGDYKNALHWFNTALEIREKVLGNDHSDIAATYTNIAIIYNELSDYGKAIELYQKSLAIEENVLGKDHPSFASTCNNLAIVYFNKGDHANALRMFQEALNIRKKIFGGNHPDTFMIYSSIGWVYNYQENYDEALKWCQKSVNCCERVLGKDHLDTATAYNNIAGIYHNIKNYEISLIWFQKTLSIREKKLKKEHPDIASTYNNIASIYYNQGEYDKAMELYNKALTIRTKLFGKDHPDIADIYNNIAGIHYSRGNYTKARDLYTNALGIFEKKFGTDHHLTKLVQYNINELMECND